MTESEFPVSHGETLAVSCQEDYNNTGSDEITCNTYLYNDFSYTLEPLCILGKTMNYRIKYQGIYQRMKEYITELINI